MLNMFLLLHDLPMNHNVDMNKFRLHALTTALQRSLPFHPANVGLEDIIMIDADDNDVNDA